MASAALTGTLLAGLGGPVARANVTPSTAQVSSGVLSPEQAAARATLRTFQKTYRLLEGVTVSIAPSPGGEQAVAFYDEGRIVIDPAHAASVQQILAHEVWHIIDWRDDGRITWGERVPPADISPYLK